VIRVRGSKLWGRITGVARRFSLFCMSKPALQPIQSHIHGLPGFFPRSEREVHHSAIVPKLRIRGLVLELPHCIFMPWTRTTLLLRAALVRVITQRRVVISYPRFVTTQILEEGTGMLSRNVGQKLLLLAA
jgi:hypothetical protein